MKNYVAPPSADLLALIRAMGIKKTFYPVFAGLTLTGLTPSLPVVTDVNKKLTSLSFSTFKTNLAIAQADVSGLASGSSPTFAGLTLTGLSGYVKATAGVLGAGGINAGDVPGLAAAYIDWNASSGGASIKNKPTILTNPMDGAGQLIVGGTGGAPAKLVAGTDGKFLTYAAGALTWSAVKLPGSGIISAGKILYGSSSDIVGAIDSGTTSQILVGGGAAAPVWTTATGTGAPVRKVNPSLTLDSYADNTAAISGGLLAGALYKVTGSNPMQVAIVY